jgi:Holliday junction resolvase-like predicted endonuclease
MESDQQQVGTLVSSARRNAGNPLWVSESESRLYTMRESSRGVIAHGTGSRIIAKEYHGRWIPDSGTPVLNDEPYIETVEDLSWPQTTWLTRNYNTIMSGIQVGSGLIQLVNGYRSVRCLNPVSIFIGILTIENGFDDLKHGVAGLWYGDYYRTDLSIATSQGLQYLGADEDRANFAGDLIPLASAALSFFGIACFAADTKLRTPEGLKAIQDFKSGDLILTRHESVPNGKIETKHVEEVFQTSAEIIELTLNNEAVIRTSGEHPFYVFGLGWRIANELCVGDLVITDQDTAVSVTNIVNTGDWQAVYNLRVADHHTYFVGDESWGFAVWSHNRCGNSWVGGIGERLAMEILLTKGHTILTAVKNASGHGIDIITLNKNGRLMFWEVKTSLSEVAPALSKAQRSMDTFVRTRLARAAAGGAHWAGSPAAIKGAEDVIARLIAGAKIRGGVLNVTNLNSHNGPSILLGIWKH